MTTFRANGPKMIYLTLLWSHTFNFHKPPLVLFEILFHTPQAASLFYKFYFIGGLGPSDHFYDDWAKNGLPGIILEPHIEFSQTTPHFGQNFILHTKLLVFFRNVALSGAWNLVTTFDTIRRISKKLPQP